MIKVPLPLPMGPDSSRNDVMRLPKHPQHRQRMPHDVEADLSCHRRVFNAEKWSQKGEEGREKTGAEKKMRNRAIFRLLSWTVSIQGFSAFSKDATRTCLPSPLEETVPHLSGAFLAQTSG